MPLYEWECSEHGRFEASFRIKEKPQATSCPKCGKESLQVVCIGGVQGDELPTWFNREARGCLQDDSSARPIESRTDYKRYLKEHGIQERSVSNER